jgi:hypothetical protein
LRRRRTSSAAGFITTRTNELRWRYAAAIPGVPEMSREELESRANAWQIERQRHEGMLLCCDVQYAWYETCRAWDDFTNEELANCWQELSGQKVRVKGKVWLPVI